LPFTAYGKNMTLNMPAAPTSITGIEMQSQLARAILVI
jgi:hypothetical protein